MSAVEHSADRAPRHSPPRNRDAIAGFVASGLLCVFEWHILLIGEAFDACQKGIVKTPSAKHTIGITCADAKLLLHVIKYDKRALTLGECVDELFSYFFRPDAAMLLWLDPIPIEALECSSGYERKLRRKDAVEIVA